MDQLHLDILLITDDNDRSWRYPVKHSSFLHGSHQDLAVRTLAFLLLLITRQLRVLTRISSSIGAFERSVKPTLSI